jgi:hypothetical protein
MQNFEQVDDVAVKGIAIYNERLKTVLEPEHNNEYLVIRVDNGDYAIAKRRSDAGKIMRIRHGIDGRLLAMRIGPEPEYGLAARLFPNSGSKPR